jgi:exonuclease III
MKSSSVGDVYGRLEYMRRTEEPRRYKAERKRNPRSWIPETQNVRGFPAERKRQWVGTWRRTPLHERPRAWLLQETHVILEEEASELAADWRKLWGLHNADNSPRLSYWSIDETKTGGVAILIIPAEADQVSPWQEERLTKRALAITYGDKHIFNIYAPNNHQTRETLYHDLQQWKWSERDTILAGDFNCVMSPALDRLGGDRTGRSESAELQHLLEGEQLEDASTLTAPTEDDDDYLEPTYWGPEAASRIDRFYVRQTWTAQVEWVAVEQPIVASGHRRVRQESNLRRQHPSAFEQ